MSQKSKWGVIINPVAGNGFAGEYSETIKTEFKKRNINAEIVFTERKKHATALAENLVNNGYDHIVGVGGDGTFNEIVQSLIGKKNIVFGAIPAGTGNDFVSILGYFGRFSENDWEVFFAENTIQMDVGKCNDKYFLNGMGLGFDAQVAAENYEPEDSGAVKKGSQTKYWWHIIKTLVSYQEKDMKVTIDNVAHEQKTFLNTIANGRRLAGGFYLAPDAIVNDGFLNICMIEELGFIGRINELLKVIKQKHTQDKVVNYFKTKNIFYEFDNQVPAHLDGELYFDSSFEVSIVPSALSIIYNPDGNHFFQ